MWQRRTGGDPPPRGGRRCVEGGDAPVTGPPTFKRGSRVAVWGWGAKCSGPPVEEGGHDEGGEGWRQRWMLRRESLEWMERAKGEEERRTTQRGTGWGDGPASLNFPTTIPQPHSGGFSRFLNLFHCFHSAEASLRSSSERRT